MSKCIKCGNEILTGDIHWEMGLCNNCYNELYKKISYVGLLNREMDGLLDDYAKRRIDDLEAKLAEAQKTIEIQKMSNDALQEENLDYRYDITDTAYEQAKEMASNWESQYQEEIKELKAKLAENQNCACKHIGELTKIATEKDRKIEELRQQLAEKDETINNLNKQFLKDIENVKKWWAYQYEGGINKDNQDKISFALEQLKKVKDSFFDVGNGWWLCFRDGTQYMTHDELEGCVRDVIDNQIKQLKGVK